LRDRAATISTQVLQEFYDRATRKLHIERAVARAQVRRLTSLQVVQVSSPIILAATELQERRRISFWDALIVRAAVTADCDELWTEDLQAGAVFDGVRVVNPFA
jgi:predicted nucleic acid-binding protein